MNLMECIGQGVGVRVGEEGGGEECGRGKRSVGGGRGMCEGGEECIGRGVECEGVCGRGRERCVGGGRGVWGRERCVRGGEECIGPRCGV